MRHTKKWGTVSGGAELYMLNRAERTHKQLNNKKRSGKGGKQRCNG